MPPASKPAAPRKHPRSPLVPLRDPAGALELDPNLGRIRLRPHGGVDELAMGGGLIALRRRDLDLDSRAALVHWSPVKRPSGHQVALPKNNPVRLVTWPAVLVVELRRQMAMVAMEPDALFFTGERGATPRRAHFVRTWHTARRVAGVSDAVHFHDLRHTGNHCAAASGASTRELMARMGCASMRAALIYQQATADRDRAIARALDQLVEGASQAL